MPDVGDVSSQARHSAEVLPSPRGTTLSDRGYWADIMTIEINERQQTGEAAELPGLILVISLVLLLTLVCWLSL